MADARFGRGLVRSLLAAHEREGEAHSRQRQWHLCCRSDRAARHDRSACSLVHVGPIELAQRQRPGSSGFKDAFRQVRKQAEQAQSLLDEATSKLRSDVAALKDQRDAAQGEAGDRRGHSRPDPPRRFRAPVS